MTVGSTLSSVVSPAITSRNKEEVKDAAVSYENYHASFGGSLESRKAAYADMVNKYYDLSTSFYEYGWGTSFHFAHRYKGESHTSSIKRHEHYLALKLGLKKGQKVLDVGCGIGGPLREIAMFSGAGVVGLNNNAYQISRGEFYNRKVGGGVQQRCSFVKGDFMKMPFPENTFDAVYEIDATCHSPDVVNCYKEVLRVLKPGQCFAGYEWCSTNLYDPTNEVHKKQMDDIELGNGLPEVRSCDEVKAALIQAGFEVVEDEDLALSSEVSWYHELDPSRWDISFSLTGLRTTALGRLATRVLVGGMEKLGAFPEGSGRVHHFLERAADSLVAGGRLGIFTPMYFFVARKPLSGKPAASSQ